MPTAYDDGLAVTTIYSAERLVARAIASGGTIDFHGSALWLGDCRDPVYTPDQQPLLQGIVQGLYRKHRTPGRPAEPPVLRISRRAHRRAWYDRARHEIVLPSMQWSLTGLVLAHETAHACTGGGHNQRSAHGKRWRTTYAAVATDIVGPAAGLLLLDALDTTII